MAETFGLMPWDLPKLTFGEADVLARFLQTRAKQQKDAERKAKQQQRARRR